VSPHQTKKPNSFEKLQRKCGKIIFMQRKFFTKKGSVYIQTIEGNKEFWIKQDKDGEIQPLVGGFIFRGKNSKNL